MVYRCLLLAELLQRPELGSPFPLPRIVRSSGRRQSMCRRDMVDPTGVVYDDYHINR